MLYLSVFILICVLSNNVGACPYYQTIGGTRVDYTTFEGAYNVAKVNGIPIRVCDQAKIESNENVPIISDPITVIGDVSDHRAHWSVEASNLTSVFFVTANNVVFQDIQFVFENTMIEVRDNGYVFLDHVRFWFGQVGVNVATNEGVGGDFLGMEGDHTVFLSVGIAVLIDRGDVICIDCDIINPREGGYIARAGSAFSRVTTFDNTFVDTVIPFGVQSQAGRPIIEAELSDQFIDEASIVNCRTYPDSCATFGGSGGGSSTSKNNGFTTRDIIFALIVGLCIFTIFVSLIAIVVQKKRKDENVIIR